MPPSTVARSMITPMPRVDLVARAQSPQTNCDGQNIFFCPTGTCYTGSNGYIGCCTVSDCVVRTTCLDYNPQSSTSCNLDHGGCITCTNAATPSCRTISNALEDQFIMYCAPTGGNVVTSYTNLVTTGSTALFPPLPSKTSATSAKPAARTHSASSATKSAAQSALGASSSNSSTSSSNSSISDSAIAGIVVGAIALLGALAAIIFTLLKRRRQNADMPSPIAHHSLAGYSSDKSSPTGDQSYDPALGLGHFGQDTTTPSTANATFSPRSLGSTSRFYASEPNWARSGSVIAEKDGEERFKPYRVSTPTGENGARMAELGDTSAATSPRTDLRDSNRTSASGFWASLSGEQRFSAGAGYLSAEDAIAGGRV